MKIMYIDTSVDGHHITYMSALIESRVNNCVLVIPENQRIKITQKGDFSCMYLIATPVLSGSALRVCSQTEIFRHPFVYTL